MSELTSGSSSSHAAATTPKTQIEPKVDRKRQMEELGETVAGSIYACDERDLAALADAVAARVERLCFRPFKESAQYKGLLEQASVEEARRSKASLLRGSRSSISPTNVPAVGPPPPVLASSRGSSVAAAAAAAAPFAPPLLSPRATTVSTTAPGAAAAAAKQQLPPPHKAHKVSEELSDVTYLQSVKMSNEQLGKAGRPSEMLSLPEERLVVIGKSAELRKRLKKHNGRQLSRVYPKGMRFNSSNLDMHDMASALSMGVQMVALNFQTWEGAMQLNHALFQQNDGRGYVLKPPANPSPTNDPPIPPLSVSAPGEGETRVTLAEGEKLEVVVHSAQHLPKKDGERLMPDPWDDPTVYPWAVGAECKYAFDEESMALGDVTTSSIEISLVGSRASELPSFDSPITAEMAASAVPLPPAASEPGPGSKNNGLLPVYSNARLRCVAWSPESAYLRVVVIKHRRSPLGISTRKPIAYEMIPLPCLRTGFRSVPLRSPTCGSHIRECSLLVEVRREHCMVSMEVGRGVPSPVAVGSPRVSSKASVVFGDAPLSSVPVPTPCSSSSCDPGTGRGTTGRRWSISGIAQ